MEFDRDHFFRKAKTFSDFIAFHVRFQFIVLAVFFAARPWLVQSNENLFEGKGGFAVIDYAALWIALVGLCAYAIWMFLLILSVVRRFIVVQFRWHDGGIVRRTLAIVAIGLAVALEFLMNGAIVWSTYSKDIEKFGIRFSDVGDANRRIWENSCWVWQSNCKGSTPPQTDP